MKKKLLFLLLIFIVCIPAKKVFADDAAMDPETGEVFDKLTAYVVKTGSEKEMLKFKDYEISIPVDTEEIVVPIVFNQKGILVSTEDFNEDANEYMFSNLVETVYQDAECSVELDRDIYTNDIFIPKKGTYYIKLSFDTMFQTVKTECIVNYHAQFYIGTDRTLADKKTVYSGNIDKKPLYYKIVIPTTGNLAVETNCNDSFNLSAYKMTITLLNSEKKALSGAVDGSNGFNYFTVGKGTYYIKVVSTPAVYSITTTLYRIADKSGSSESKAYKLSKGKTYSGCITLTDKKNGGDWYKITLTKSQSIDINFTGTVSSGEIWLEFTGDDIGGSIDQSINKEYTDSSFTPAISNIYYYSSSELPEGTYYLRIYKKDSKSSGVYKIGYE